MDIRHVHTCICEHTPDHKDWSPVEAFEITVGGAVQSRVCRDTPSCTPYAASFGLIQVCDSPNDKRVLNVYAHQN